MKHVNELLLQAKEETLLQGMTEGLIEIGSCNGMEMNVEKTNVTRILRQPSLVHIMRDQRHPESVE